MDSVHRELLFSKEIKFAAFFPCKNFPKMILCVCKVTSSECLNEFHCGARGYTKVYAEESLALWQSDKS